MRNITLVLAFMLVSIFSYANNNSTLKNELTFENLKSQHMSNLDLASCKITIRKKNPDGTYTEITVEIHNTTCDKLVKSVISNL